MKDDVKENQALQSEYERGFCKRLEVVMQVFRLQADKIRKIDRQWQQVLDSQVYILEEVIKPGKTDQRNG